MRAPMAGQNVFDYYAEAAQRQLAEQGVVEKPVAPPLRGAQADPGGGWTVK
jgi:hypothetical protein